MASGRFGSSSSRGNGNGGRASRGRGGNMAVGMRPVSEADRISIMDRLQQFRDGSAEEMTFEAGLSNHDRAVVHNFCQKMGFKSKSYGKGDERRVTVCKASIRKTKAPAAATPISFSRETQQILQELFTRFPPSEDEGALTTGISKAAVDVVVPMNFSHEKALCLSMTPAEIAKQVALLTKRKQSMPSLRRIAEATSKLPIAKYHDTITSAVDQNQVVIIAGETGCGKSTQVPQFILDHMWAQKKPCRVICTQPRRISATSVADRVATERGESIGETVGYQIRLESKGGPHSSLMFCTNGVLLRKLVMSRNTSEDGLNGVGATHIIVDEIHERDCNADFLLIILKDLLSSQPNLRLVLMSATLDAELFSAYFNRCPVLKVPGFTHPVRLHYLEDALTLIDFGKDDNSRNARADPEGSASNASVLKQEDADEMDNALTCAWLDDDFEPLMSLVTENPTSEMFDYQHSVAGATALMVAAGKGRADDVSLLLSLGANCSLLSQDGNTALDWAVSNGEDDVAALIRDHIDEKSKSQLAAEEAELLGKYHKTVDQEEINVALIERLLQKIYTGSDDGAILVFFPGWEDITRCRERLISSPIFSDSSKFLILPLHSMVPMSDQKKIFQSPPPGVRKIVLATNIAETAITIDDVVFVIDSGRVKEKSYDPYSNVSTFQTTWISKASARQREGRAGRCRPGVCYHLFSKVRAAALADFQPPEMKRTPLEELCLKVKLLQPNGSIRDFLSKALDPPLDISIQNAVSLLQDIGALTSKEELTDLGNQLGSLPVHPATSKMLLLATLLNCLDPALTIACAAGYREPFVLPVASEQKKHAFAARHQLAAPYGGYSDHLAVIAAFEGWEAARKKGQEHRFCSQNFLSPGVMVMLDGMRRQLLNELVQKGFVPREPHPCSLNAGDPGIVRAVLVSCMYPMVGRLLPPLPNGQKAVVQIARGEKVRIHPQSANFRLVHHRSQDVSIYNQHLLVFDEITRGEAQVYIRNSTLVRPHPLLFICTEISVAPVEAESDSDNEDDDDMGGVVEKGKQLMDAPDKMIAMVVDRWLQYQTTSVDAAQIYCLRERLLGALYFKIKNPQSNLPDLLAASVYALACVLSYEGALAHEGEAPSSGFQSDVANRRVILEHQDKRTWSRVSSSSSETRYRSQTISGTKVYMPVRDARPAR